MSFVKIPPCSHSFEPQRPKFNHQNTQDRLREADLRRSSMTSKIKKDRKSVFREEGLAPGEEEGGAQTTFRTSCCIDEPAVSDEKGDLSQRTGLAPLDTRSACAEHCSTTGRRTASACETDEKAGRTHHDSTGGEDNNRKESSSPRLRPSDAAFSSPPQSPTSKTPWYAKLATGRRPRVRQGSSAPPSPVQSLSTMTMLVLAVAVVAPLFGRSAQDPASVVDAGPITMRANSPTDVCARWAQQTALLNGTLYIYGGEAKTTMDQENNTWNNDFLTLDLTSTWETSSPALTGLPQPSGPPAVSLGILWHDYNNLYLYGGEFADNPYATPAAVATWQYAIHTGTWTSYTDLTTSAGNASSSDAGGVAVQRAAEGAGVSVPELGLSWYFGGHLDWSTTPGWSDQIARVYLKSLLEFTHPGYTNDAVTALRGSGAPAAGAYRNITQGGLQGSDAFTERADGVLIFVPGWGASGVLIGLGGGTASEFTDDMSTLDVYDIASSQWYHQQTTGTAPGVRVNACGVVASAPDASSFQIYLFGGQNLQPAGNQIQYDDMYILTIPSFTWVGPIAHSGAGSSIPYARAGHTCNLRDGQMVVVGGFNTTVTSCDNSQGGVYVFNASSLAWLSSFTALSPSADHDPGNTVLANSYGYTVPDEVVSVIGGNPSGSATITAPAASATGGPFATGQPPVYTITASGSTATITSSSSSSSSSTGISGSSSSSSKNSGGLIAAIVVACLAGALAGYLGYCAWLYRRQVRAYKTHLAVTNRFPARSASHGSFGRMLAFGRKGSASQRRTAAEVDGTTPAMEEKKGLSWWGRHHDDHRRDESGGGGGGDGGVDSAGGESFAWVGRDKQQQLLLDPNAGANINRTTTTTMSTNKTTRTSSGSHPSPWSAYGDDKSGGSGSAAGSRGSGEASGTSGENHGRRADSISGGSTTSSTEGLLDGQEPSFFSVVLGPRRALRVVNGLEETEGH